MHRSVLLAVLGVVASATTAGAQPASPGSPPSRDVESTRADVAAPRLRTIDLGGFVGVHAFPGDIELGNSWAAEQTPHTAVVLGGRVGLTLLPDLAPASTLDPQLGVEGELALALASTGESVEGGRDSYFAPVFGWRAHGIFRLRTAGVVHPHLVVGVGGESVASRSPFMFNDTDAAFYWGAGLTWQASRSWTARADLRHELTAGRMDDPVSTFELHLGVERSFELGGGAGEPLPPPAPAPIASAKPPAALDTDGDGVMDDRDACVREPEDKDGFEDGDGCPDADNDKDRVPDASDGCPIEPEDADQFQDQDGCPDLDDDGDGIPDAADKCRLEPETLNGFEDGDGCPDEVPAAVQQFTGVISGITFAYSRAAIRKPSKKLLNHAASVLRQYPDLRVRVEGHTDPRGNYEKNKSLSLRRAEAVKWYLVDQGIAADRIETLGLGPDQPRASNKTPKGRAANRRIEFHLIVDVDAAAPASKPSSSPSPESSPESKPNAPASQPSPPASQPSESPVSTPQ